MPTQVSVNSGQITINDRSTFLVTDSNGSIDETLAQGFFVADTRLLSYYEVSINRDRLSLLASSPINYHSALYQFTNQQLQTVNGIVPSGRLLFNVAIDPGQTWHTCINFAAIAIVRTDLWSQRAIL